MICHGVLHYLDDAAATAAIDHLASATRAVLYPEVPTTRDLAEVVDREATDFDVHARKGAWYRRRLMVHLQQAGAGFWVRRDTIPRYELEGAAGQ